MKHCYFLVSGNHENPAFGIFRFDETVVQLFVRNYVLYVLCVCHHIFFAQLYPITLFGFS